MAIVVDLVASGVGDWVLSGALEPVPPAPNLVQFLRVVFLHAMPNDIAKHVLCRFDPSLSSNFGLGESSTRSREMFSWYWPLSIVTGELITTGKRPSVFSAIFFYSSSFLVFCSF